MRILGIDPGLATTGFAVIDYQGGGLTVIDFGVIKTEKNLSVGERLLEIFTGITQLIENFSPQMASIESLFFYNNQKTAIKVSQARGVVILACQIGKLNIAEYTPKQVKEAVVGYGGADKQQMQYMVKNIFSLGAIPQPDDAADAMGLCYVCAIDMRNDFI